MIRRAHLILLPVLLSAHFGSLSAQVVDSWRVFSALDRTNAAVPLRDGSVLVGTDGGAYTISADGEIVDVWRSNGELLDLDVTAVGEDPATGDLYFGSRDGAVSILRNGGWWTYAGDLSRSGKPERTITGFEFHDGDVYVLSSFGVSLFTLSDSSFRDSWTRLGPIPADTRVHDLTVVGDSLFVASEKGLAIAPRTGRDLADPLSWRAVGMEEPCGPVISSLAYVGSVLYVGTPSGVCVYMDGGLTTIAATPTSPKLEPGQDGLLLAASGDRVYTIANGSTVQDIGSVGVTVTSVAPLGSQGIIAGLERDGVALFRNGDATPILPDGPAANSFADMVVAEEGDLWVASASQGVSRLREDAWTNFQTRTRGEITTNSIRNVSLDHTGRIWGGSFGDGFFRFTPLEDSVRIERFDESNTPLQDVNGLAGLTVAEHIVSDDAGVLWGLNWDNTDGRRNALYSYRYSGDDGVGEWQAHPFSGRFFSYTKTFRWIAVDFNGTKWLAGVDKPQGLLYYVDEAGPDMAGEWNSLTQSNGLPSNAQTALLVDPDGELWIGTPSGLAILVNPWSVRQEGPSAAVFRDVPALDDIYIWDIAVDALNRKWVATDQGAFLMSSDGTELLARYTTDNSPLTDNQVLSVATDDANGFVYLGTGNGLNRLTTPAVRATDSERITAHPQPFRPGIDQEVRLDGLPSLSTVKVLTIDGRLVAEFVAPGGAVAFWDGLDQEGERVTSGIYLVVAESRDGTAVSGKIAVVVP